LRVSFENDSVNISTFSETPRCLDVNVHARTRGSKATASHYPAREAGHPDGARDAYVAAHFNVAESDSEEGHSENSAELTLFLDIEQAADIMAALGDALAAHEKSLR
jgi:hypothetical protein